LLDPSSIGHTGFTGTSIWIDPTRELVIVLLTNRVHPTRENNRMGPVRRGVADRIVQGLSE
jgi:CubicO group peptidase (beta-lactamase class C family)